MDDREYFDAMFTLQAKSQQFKLLSAGWEGEEFVVVVDKSLKANIPAIHQQLGRIAQADRRLNVSGLFAKVVVKTAE